MSDLSISPLHERHVELGAKLAEFGGWSMPLEYSGAGVVKEHKAVREAVGLFDVSHLGKALVRGEGAAAFVNATLSNDLGKIAAGKAQYTLCCDADTGGVVDDLIELDAITKLGGQIVAAGFLVLNGVQLWSLNLPGVGQFSLDPTQAMLLSILLVVGTMNAVNFVDGLDGLAAGVRTVLGWRSVRHQP